MRIPASSSFCLVLLACVRNEPTAPIAEPAPLTEPIPDLGEGARAKDESHGAGSAGILGALEDHSAAFPEFSSGMGGLIGTEGTQVGTGGLGSQGSGLGAGGIEGQPLGGLRVGSGKGGYGSGRFGQPLREALGTEHYTNPGIHGPVLTESDPLSTFSIDVDTASFAIARRYLEGNQLPPVDSVRVEEFINAQDFVYGAPHGDAPFAVNMEATPSPIEANHHVLRVGVKAAEPPTERLPVHLTFLVDVSCSMAATDKLPLAQKALHHLVDNLEPEDRVAVVTYAGNTAVTLHPTTVEDRDLIHDAIRSLRQGGGTSMDNGMHLAYGLALEHLAPGTENRVIVLSDGDANIGRTSHVSILKSLEGYADQGISLSTIGFGRGNYRDTLMEQLANKGDGNYFYIDRLEEAQKVFGEKLLGTLQTVARDVKIQVDFNPDAVQSYRLIGYENREIADADFRKDAVDAGEIGAGHTVTALYDLVLKDQPDGPLATVRMRSKPPGPDAPAVERYTELPSDAIHTEFAAASRDFRIAWTAATFAELLRGSPYVSEFSYSTLAETGRRARRSADDDALIELIETADRLGTDTRVSTGD